MPQVEPKRKPPALLAKTTLEILRELEREQYDLKKQFTAYHDDLFRSYTDTIKREFLRYLVPGPEPRWDAQAAIRAGVPDELADSFEELTAALTDTDEDTFEEELDDALEEGFDQELWLLALGGLPAEQYAEELPPAEGRSAILLAAGVGGLSWAARMQTHRYEVDAKMRQWLKATIAGGRPLDETLGGVDHLTRRFDTRLIGLFDNEHYRAHGLGAEMALGAARQDYEIVEVWVARTNPDGSLDRLVCPVCEALHLTVTAAQPVTDSHPACRCRKVPVPAGYQETPVTYAEFLRRLRG